MAIDRRATRLGVLGLVGLILFGLIGVRLVVPADGQGRRAAAAVDDRRASARCASRPSAAASSTPKAGSWPTTSASSRSPSTGSSAQADRPARDLPAPVGVGRRTDRGHGGALRAGRRQPVPADADQAGDRRADRGRAARALRRLPRLHILTQWRRVYPYAPHAAHVVGYMGAITEDQWKSDLQDAGYLLNERVGQFGVEKSMESVLHGTWGRQVYEVDAANRPVRLIEDIPPINGFDVQLTIDLKYQQYAEQAARDHAQGAAHAARAQPEDPQARRSAREDGPGAARRGVLQGAGGVRGHHGLHRRQIIAMASYPTFDNRWFEAGLSSKKFDEIFPSFRRDGVTPIDPDQSILVNRAIQGRYNLGSTFKPFTAFAALNTGLIDGRRLLPRQRHVHAHADSVDLDRCRAGGSCAASSRTPRAPARNAPCKYGPVNVEDALAVSIDAFFYRIGEQIMVRNDFKPVLQDRSTKFGFGSDTGIELPFEFDGTVPDDALKERLADLGVLSKDEGQACYPGDNVQLAIGQGLLSATPLQLAAAYAALANRGFVLQPKIVKAIWNPGVPDGEPGFVDFSQGTVFEDRRRPEARCARLPMPDEIRDPIVHGLRASGLPGRGCRRTSDFYHTTTGENLFYDYPGDAIPIAGKTGTAQGADNYPWNDSSVFAAFSVDDAPTRTS